MNPLNKLLKNRHYSIAEHPDLNHYELSVWLHTLASSLISIFVPILMLNLGYSLHGVVLYYFLYNFLDIPLNFEAKKLLEKLGAKKILFLGTLYAVLYFLFLGLLPPNDYGMIIILSLLAALYDTHYWVAHEYILMESNRKEKFDTGKTLGFLGIIKTIAGVIGPIIGGFILINLGEPILIVASVTIFGISLIPLLKFRHVADIPKIQKIKHKQFFSQKQEQRNFLSIALWGVQGSVEGNLLPIFIYMVFKNIEMVAFMPVLGSIGSTCFAYLAGKYSRKHSIRMMVGGSLVVLLIWTLRIILHLPLFYFFSVLIVGFLSLFVGLPIEKFILDRSKTVGTLASSTYRNASSMLLHVPLYLILLFSENVFGTSFFLAILSIILLIGVLKRFNNFKEKIRTLY